jgi:hypothetical protein
LIYSQKTRLFQVGDPVQKATVPHQQAQFNELLDAIDGVNFPRFSIVANSLTILRLYSTYSAHGKTGNESVIDEIFPNPQLEGYNSTLQCDKFQPTIAISISYGIQETDLTAYVCIGIPVTRNDIKSTLVEHLDISANILSPRYFKHHTIPCPFGANGGICNRRDRRQWCEYYHFRAVS